MPITELAETVNINQWYDRDDDWWHDYFTAIHICACRELPRPHRLHDWHPSDGPL